ncbi:hypothetical protein KC19_11G149000 [Ceratodon purpureus]|uniref:Uncharacterized protein n=1 Tax=Ceratodon purpureus TaxID=3225 RepID=A0A8T0GKT9_CERPU|nr:hypothetical protein KC19_11G149000 [Ceratodon purpureus]
MLKRNMYTEVEISRTQNRHDATVFGSVWVLCTIWSLDCQATHFVAAIQRSGAQSAGRDRFVLMVSACERVIDRDPLRIGGRETGRAAPTRPDLTRPDPESGSGACTSVEVVEISNPYFLFRLAVVIGLNVFL